MPHSDACGWSALKTEIQYGLCSHVQCASVAFHCSWSFFFFFLLLSSKLTLSILSVHFSSHYDYECCINSMAGDEAVQLASLPNMENQGNIPGHGGHSS